jgi:deoxyribonuclease-4
VLLGAHESVAGGLANAFERGREHGCAAMQIFARPKATWRAPALVASDVAAFRQAHAATDWPLLSHTSYLINLGSADPVILEKSLTTLEDEMVRAETLGLDYVVLHPGAHLGAGPATGVARAAACLSQLMDRTRGFHARLLLELTAGQGSCLGCSFDELGQLLEQTRGGEQLGICFDTCHAFAGGYDLGSEAGYEAVWAAFEQRIGWAVLRAFHLNDSKTPLGSGVDRHEEIGDGTMGLYPFWRLVNDPRFAGLPGILETPSGADKLPSYARNLARLRALIGADRPAHQPRPPAPTGRKRKKDAPDAAQIALGLEPSLTRAGEPPP